ncbi:alpha-2C adrenergic receptor-like [Paramacrobiotus metropolitanus]|uniref:alpha-2C adrenergic receptor-like n=1 Tax=Paramacrobiotus metropolitanus TaxID=2943436 RepID=UPI002445C0BC|nr:alpha-2C adrenergic receptor-like [Paramacrobiotus metropolitanus]XP_055328762.1 alpha-2C adrenergic receptor-like [Paramacrobiotus metropolitanus]
MIHSDSTSTGQLWNYSVFNVTFPDVTAHYFNRSPAGNIVPNNAPTEAISCQQIPGENIPFPSCYTWPQIILFAFFMAVVMFIIVFGNLLVIISIMTNTSLKTVQNYLLVSLAIADCMVGAIIMPFSLANDLMGYWAFGDILCDFWLALDVLLCTASILSLCAISLDRYWSVTQAVTYLQRRTPRRAALMILAVWMLSLTISVPPMFGWKSPPNMTEIVTFANESVRETAWVKICSIGEDTSEYAIFSSLGSFWIPLAVMSVVYVRIYAVARARATGPDKKKPDITPASKNTKPSISSAVPIPAIKVDPNPAKSRPSCTADTHRPNSTITTYSKDHNERKPLLTKPSLRPEVSDQHLPLTNDESNSYPESRSPSSADETPSSSSEKPATAGGATAAPARTARTKYHGTKRDYGTQTETIIHDEQRPTYINDDEYAETSSIMLLSEFDFDKRWRDFFERYFAPLEAAAAARGVSQHAVPRSVSENNNLAAPNGTLVTADVAVISTESVPYWHRVRRWITPLLQWRRARTTTDNRGYRLQVNKDARKKISRKKAKKHVGSRKATASDFQDEADRRKRRIQKAKERRATLVVTLVIATFVACWMPFFIVLPLKAICGEERCPMDARLFAGFFWLGYFNSALNPVIYTIFNRDFRKAFMRVLFGANYSRKKENRQKGKT